MKKFDISVEIKLMGTLTVEAEDQEAAFKKADDTMYWAYQAGSPEKHKDFSITGCEIEVEGDELDLDEYREPEEEES